MDSTQGLEEFVAIVETGSISAAARSLGAPRPTVSRRLKQLEERLGVRLAHRSTRRFLLTRAGQELFTRARRIVAEARAAEEAIRRLDDVPRGLLRVAAPSGGAGTFLNDCLVGFLERWPEVELEVVHDPRHVDLAGEGFDVALRGGQGRDPSLIARKLLGTRMVAVASPSYLDRVGRPSSPRGLAAHECFARYAGGAEPVRRWPLLEGGEVAVSGRLSGNDMGLQLRAATRGMGIAMAPLGNAQLQIDDGLLEIVLPGVLGREIALYVVYIDRELLDPKVRAFVDHMVETFAGDEVHEQLYASLVRPPPLPR